MEKLPVERRMMEMRADLEWLDELDVVEPLDAADGERRFGGRGGSGGAVVGVMGS